MKQIVWIVSAFALMAAAVPERPQTVARPEPGYAASAEPCLADPPFPDWWSNAPEQPSGPDDWSDCTADEAEAAILRQCATDEQPGTIAHEMCLSTRRERDLRRRADTPAADPPPPGTTWEAANHACRGQTWRRPSETVRACTERLVSTDALSQPLPQGREPTEPQCRRESVQREDGTGFRASVTCTETTSVPARPR
jgi:hypothetical protein